MFAAEDIHENVNDDENVDVYNVTTIPPHNGFSRLLQVPSADLHGLLGSQGPPSSKYFTFYFSVKCKNSGIFLPLGHLSEIKVPVMLKALRPKAA